MLAESNIAKAITGAFEMTAKKQTKPGAWEEMYRKMGQRQKTVRIALVGKYMEQSDAYLSVLEAIRHAGLYHKVFTEIVPINSEDPELENLLSTCDALIIPGGFGNRGTDGKIAAAKYAREHHMPFLGICLGLQIATIEISRAEAGLKQASSREFDENCPECVIDFLPEQLKIIQKGGTMRLGSYPAVLKKGSLVEDLYKAYRPEELSKDGIISERHRHRYEVNPVFHEHLQKAGLIFSGMSSQGELVEFIELPKTVHPYFVATQAHPEFRSRPHRPHPLFAGLIAAATKH
jgi:CTP synthase